MGYFVFLGIWDWFLWEIGWWVGVWLSRMFWVARIALKWIFVICELLSRFKISVIPLLFALEAPNFIGGFFIF